MGLFEENIDQKQDAKGGGKVESLNKNNQELQDLLNEFKEMRNGSNYHLEEEDIVEEEFDDGEEYRVSEEESESIESFLSDDEIIEEEEEFLDEEVFEDEEEVVDEEEIFEEELDDSDIDYVKYFDDDEDLDYDEDVVDEDELLEEEPIDVKVNITEIPNYEDESEKDSKIQEQQQNDNSVITNDEIDRKFDEFEKRLLEKMAQQFAVLGAAQVAKATKNEQTDEVEVKTVKGQLVINGYTFTGEVVMFTPLDTISQATWEEVVRRKGHCTYHLTTSGNGGWFIKKSNAPNPYAYIEKKEDAEELAKFYAMKEKAELKIHNAKGVIEKSLSFGREKLRG